MAPQAAVESSRLIAALNAVGDGILLVDADGAPLLASKQAELLLGRLHGHSVFERIVGLVAPEERAGVTSWLRQLLVSGDGPAQVLVRLAGPDATWHDVELRGENLLAVPAVEAVVLDLRDVTAQRRSELTLAAVQRCYAVLAEANDALLQGAQPSEVFERACAHVAGEGGFRMAWFGRIEGHRVVPEAVTGVGADYARSLTISVDEGSEHGRGPTGTAARLGRTISCPDIQGNPSMRPWHTVAEAFGYRSSLAIPVLVHGQVRGVLTVYSARTDGFDPSTIRLLERVAANVARSWESTDAAPGDAGRGPHDATRPEPAQQAARAAQLDAPTTPVDRHTAFSLLAASLRSLEVGQRLQVLLVNIDGFRRIIEGYGPDVGDDVLVAVAHRLRQLLPASALLARLGSDEFLVGVAQDDAAGHVELTATIMDHFAAPLRLGSATRPVSVCIGVTSAADAAREPKDLIREARDALRCAKRRGRGRACLYDAAVRQRSERRRTIERDLEGAVARQELFVLYQPVIDLARGTVVGAEALVRWQHPELGLLMPEEFIPVAEETGDIVQLGRYVLREATRTCARYGPSTGNRPYIAVNVSAWQLSDGSLVESLERAVAQAGCLPDDVVLEVTETALAQDAERAIATLTEVRARGARVAIDDFGTGYSSFSQLRTLPVDILKIDRSFVDTLPGDADAYAVVSAIITVAAALHKVVVAEGVETDDQRDALSRMSCSFAQGYLWARPDTPDALLAMLVRQSDGTVPV